MKVLLATDTFLPRRDGVVYATISLAKGLARYGHDVALVVPFQGATPSADIATLAIPAIRTPIDSFPLGLATWHTVRRKLQKSRFEPDIVHVQTPGTIGCAAARFAEKHGLPSVLTWQTDLVAYRQAYPALLPATLLAYLLGLYAQVGSGSSVAGRGVDVLRSLIRADPTLAYRQALSQFVYRFDAVVVPSEKARDLVRAVGRTSQVHVIPDTPASPPAHPIAGEALLRGASHVRPESEQIVIFVGRPAREKNVELMAEVFLTRVVSQVPAARLVIVGGHYKVGRLRRRIADRPNGSRISWLGPVPNWMVRALMLQSQVHAFPSLTDTQGLVIREASLAGIPTVALDPQLDSQIIDGRTGYLAQDAADFADKLVLLLRHPPLRRKFGAQARHLAESVDPESSVRAHVDVYSSLAHQAKRVA